MPFPLCSDVKLSKLTIDFCLDLESLTTCHQQFDQSLSSRPRHRAPSSLTPSAPRPHRAEARKPSWTPPDPPRRSREGQGEGEALGVWHPRRRGRPLQVERNRVLRLQGSADRQKGRCHAAGRPGCPDELRRPRVSAALRHFGDRGTLSRGDLGTPVGSAALRHFGDGWALRRGKPHGALDAGALRHPNPWRSAAAAEAPAAPGASPLRDPGDGWPRRFAEPHEAVGADAFQNAGDWRDRGFEEPHRAARAGAFQYACDRWHRHVAWDAWPGESWSFSNRCCWMVYWQMVGLLQEVGEAQPGCGVLSFCSPTQLCFFLAIFSLKSLLEAFSQLRKARSTWTTSIQVQL